MNMEPQGTVHAHKRRAEREEVGNFGRNKALSHQTEFVYEPLAGSCGLRQLNHLKSRGLRGQNLRTVRSKRD